jgi:hypothetical protein
MPAGVIRTPADELAWEHAKELARRQYPNADGADFYRIVMGIYKKMTHYQPRTFSRGRGRNDRR